MNKKTSTKQHRDDLFLSAERVAQDYSLFAGDTPPSISSDIQGLLSAANIATMLDRLRKMSVDDYIAEVLDPAEVKTRTSAKTVIQQLSLEIIRQVDEGPLYAAEIELPFRDGARRIGVLAQNRAVKNGVWMPEHHLMAVDIVHRYGEMNLPVVTFMDTPGADAGAEANTNNQAHSISRLITEMCNIHVPTVGIVYGLGYSGGAIPLAATNVLLAVRTGVFNTIQPKGLASIARQYNLSWQESARYVGVSTYELFKRRVIDGIVNWAPEDKGKSTEPLIEAITSSIESIEGATAKFVVDGKGIIKHYRRSVNRFYNPSEALQQLQSVSSLSLARSTTSFPNVFGLGCRYIRYLGLRRRISASTVETYGRLADEEIPAGDLKERKVNARMKAFEEWNDDPDKIVYNEVLQKSWLNFTQKRTELSQDRNRLASLILGAPRKNYEDASNQLCFDIGLYLYNRWKSASKYNFVRMSQIMLEASNGSENTGKDTAFKLADNEVTLKDVINVPELRGELLNEFKNILIFDALYNSIVDNFGKIAQETREFHVLSEKTLTELLEQPLSSGSQVVSRIMDTESGDKKDSLEDISLRFSEWLAEFARYKKRGKFLKDVEEWKRGAFPRLSESLLVLITFFFESLIPRYFSAQKSGKTYDGSINPVHIGKRKDFWNQLSIASNSLLIQRVLDEQKAKKLTSVEAFKKRFLKDFSELDANIMTANPVAFPGFRVSIEKALEGGITPCGVVTGIARFNFGKEQEVGVCISNVAFQAGAFDMAGAEKLCKLLVECAGRSLPVVCFISSGGMQTKEGPNSLFSMAIVNDRITRFIRDNDLPVIVFGFGDCTGGSQASFVTHPLVQTYYFSGTDMPFAGRVVVPSFLPSMSTVSNYLFRIEGAMRGLVKHPFAEDLDGLLRDIDPTIAIPTETVEEVIERVFEGTYLPEQEPVTEAMVALEPELMQPIKRVLIHARGCTAVKLVRIARQRKTEIVLVQSDPDMDSVAADMLGPDDQVISLGGQTSDESYLNAHSVLAIASRLQVDALHPGIGFLSENERFARLCREHSLNFIGPYARSMEVMGNKSNAINTAMSLSVPVVPGSHGILTSGEATSRVAGEVKYPVLLKAVHGGGGKGIQVVHNPDDIEEAFHKVCAEAKSAFGNGDVYLEKYVESLRHIEIQLLRDSHGNTITLGLRDCSVQRNNQKLIEESGSTLLPEELEQAAYEYTGKLADAVDYLGAGTVEFIYDLPSNAIYFMEMNTRLQVEHPVTEWTTGVSIVDEQFRIAEGHSIANLEIDRKGYAIEARITAEKAAIDANGAIDFIPTPGRITRCEFPDSDDLEVISAVSEGKTISPFYDSLIAQVICYGEDRQDAIGKLLQVLGSTDIRGVCTNIPLLKRILQDEVFTGGDYDTGYLPAYLARADGAELVREMEYSGVDSSAPSGSDLQIEGTDELKVLAPMTGIFYTTASPSEPEYAQCGDVVDIHQTLCQIEAMKIFTQVSLGSIDAQGDTYKRDNKYEVVRVNIENSAQINEGDLLFVIKPV